MTAQPPSGAITKTTDKPLAKPRGADRIPKALFPVFSAALLASIALFGWRDQLGTMSTAAGFCVVGMFFSRLEAFVEFSGFGITAKLRKAVQQAEEATKEAYATTEQVRIVALAFGAAAIESMSRGGVIGPDMSIEARMARASALEEALRVIDISEKDIDQVMGPMRFIVRFRVAQRVREESLHVIGGEQPELFAKVDQELDGLRNFGQQFVAPARQFRSVLESHSVTSPELDRLLRELEKMEGGAQA